MAKFRKLALLLTAILTTSVLAFASACHPIDEYSSSDDSSTPDAVAYTITFVNHDGEELAVVTVEEGETPVYAGEAPTKEASAEKVYTFEGWEPAITPASSDATYTAIYSEAVREYTITLNLDNGEDNVVLEGIPYGTTAEGIYAEEMLPEKVGHTFTGWYLGEVKVEETDIVTADMTLVAGWEANKYLVKFVDEDGSVLQEGEVAYGSMPTAPANPSKEATAQYTYTFAGWDSEVVAVVGEATYTATYSATLNEYTVKFVDEDGSVLQEGKVAYGSMPTAPANPSKEATAQYTYTFAGWDSEVVAVVGEATYTATYTATVNNYVVTLKLANGDTTDLDLPYGTLASVIYAEENLPTYAGHYFTGWYIDGVKLSESYVIEGNIEVTAGWMSYEEAMVLVSGSSSLSSDAKSTVSTADAGIGQPAKAKNQNVSELTLFTDTDGNQQLELAFKLPYMYQTLDKMNPTDVVRFWLYLSSSNTSAKVTSGSIYTTQGGWPTWATNDELVRINVWDEWSAYRKTLVANAWIPMDVTVAELQSGYKAVSKADHVTFYLSCGTAGFSAYVHSVELIQGVSTTAGKVAGLEWVDKDVGIVTPNETIGIPENAISANTTVAAIGRRSSTAKSYSASVYASADIYNLCYGLRTMNANDKLGFWLYCPGSETDEYEFKVSFISDGGLPKDQAPSSYTTVVKVKGGSWQLVEVSVGELKTILSALTSAKKHTYIGLALYGKYLGETPVGEQIYCHSIEYIKAN